jgi:hypothetical protein
MEMYRAAIRWNQLVDPVEFIERGTEPQLELVTSPQVP